MKSSSSIGAEDSLARIKKTLFFLILATISLLGLVFVVIQANKTDPYIKSTMEIHGSAENGNNLFRMNCVGCHGISAQGLVGPDLHNVTEELSDKKIIVQVVKGLTPPMPSFDIDEESMADLIAYLHSLKK